MAKKYAVIVGARPNFVKAAAFFALTHEYPDISFTLIHTGQHYNDNMSKIFFDNMDIPAPDIHLSLEVGTASEQLGSMISALTDVFSTPDASYDGVIVFGDVNSSLAGAIAAKSAHLPLIHVEAGLRSHDKRMPEETNRIIIDHLADMLLISEESGRIHLERAGVKAPIHAVGSLMIESVERFRDQASQHSILEDIGLINNYVVATIHRSENLGDTKILEGILRALQRIAETRVVVFPMHPGTRARIRECGLDFYLDSFVVIEPLGYLAFLDLVLNSSGVVTDSGGIQEETSHLGIPCCTLRDNTERPITIEKGSNKLFSPANLDDAAITEMEAHLSRTDFVPGSIPLWDINVSKRIIDVLL